MTDPHRRRVTPVPPAPQSGPDTRARVVADGVAGPNCSAASTPASRTASARPRTPAAQPVSGTERHPSDLNTQPLGSRNTAAERRCHRHPTESSGAKNRGSTNHDRLGLRRAARSTEVRHAAPRTHCAVAGTRTDHALPHYRRSMLTPRLRIGIAAVAAAALVGGCTSTTSDTESTTTSPTAAPSEELSPPQEQ